MKAGRSALARAVDSVVEGSSDLDWGLMTIELDDERDRELLRHIRLLSQISEIQRAEPDALDERMLRARAHAIVRRLPVETPPATEERGTADASTISQAIEAPAVQRWGRLELLELVGQGTFGDVYRARDVQLQREVAVKLLRMSGPQTALVDRMLHEARALARVQHPNVVVVHDAEERDGRVGLCMEFIRGRTLEQILAIEGPRGAGEAALIGQDVCQALAAVHAAGLVHRDVKAQNVMREQRGRVVLMDFGAGLPVNDKPTRPGSITGTPLYLAPEVLEHGHVSIRSDIYSVGILLYHLATNDYPVRGQTASELLDAHRHGRVKRLRDVAPTLPSWFVRVVERATAPNPEDRFATAGEFEAALSRHTPIRIWPLAAAAALTLAVGVGVQQVWTPVHAPAAVTPLVVLMPLDAGAGVEPYMASAFADEIYQGLAMVDTLRVISQQSAAKAKSSGLSMAQVANALGASAIAAGSVSKTTDQYEVKLRVFLAGAESPAWADTLPASSGALASLRRAASLSIARAMKVDVPTRVLRRFERPAAASAQAYESYALGRSLHARGRRADVEQARVEFERAALLDPTFAPVHAALAHVDFDIGGYGPAQWPEYAELARLSATRALALDPALIEAQAVLAEVAFQYRLELDGSRRVVPQGCGPQQELRVFAPAVRTLSRRTRSGRGRTRSDARSTTVGSVFRQHRSGARADAAVCGPLFRGGIGRRRRPRSRAKSGKSARATGSGFCGDRPL